VPKAPHGTAHDRVRPRIDRKKRRSPRAAHRDMRATNASKDAFNACFFLEMARRFHAIVESPQARSTR